MSSIKKKVHKFFSSKSNHDLILSLLYAIITVSITIFIYLNIDSLNENKILFIKVGSLAFLISLYFSFRYIKKFYKKIKFTHRHSSLLMKYLVVIIAIGLVLFLYTNQEQFSETSKHLMSSFEVSKLNPIYLGGNFSIGNLFSKESKSVRLCRENVEEEIENQINKLPVDATYSITKKQIFNSTKEAKKFEGTHSTMGAGDDICGGQNVSKIVAIAYEVRFEKRVKTPLTGTPMDKFSDVGLCNQNGKLLERGSSWECN